MDARRIHSGCWRRGWAIVAALVCCGGVGRDAGAADLAAPLGQRFATNGISLYYEQSGQGEPLVLLHAWGWSGKAWDPFVPALDRHFRVINVDLRAHGRLTGWERDDFSFDQDARDVLALADHLHLGRFRILAASAGAMTALHVAVLAPERIDSMVLIGASAFVPESLRQRPDVKGEHCADTEADELLEARAFNEGGDARPGG